MKQLKQFSAHAKFTRKSSVLLLIKNGFLINNLENLTNSNKNFENPSKIKLLFLVSRNFLFF
jgi:hypothetical protein